MGCASSLPFVSPVGNGVLGKGKESTANALHSGEEVITDVKDSIDEKVGHIKETIIDATQNVTQEIDNIFNYTKNEIKIPPQIVTDDNIYKKPKKTNEIVQSSSDFKIIPLKDPNDKMIEDALDELTSTMDETTTAEIKDDFIDNFNKTPIKKIIIGDDNDIISNELFISKYSYSDNTDMQSIDSLKTTSPEPEIERALANDIENNPPTPKPTFLELEKLQNMESITAPDLDHRTLKEMTDKFTKTLSTTVTMNEPVKKSNITKRKNFPIYKSQSNRTSSNPTKWEQRHDRLSKGNKRLHRRKSSISLYSDDSTMFKKPHTMYLVFGNNFLKTPKIKIIESQKGSRWMLKPRQTISELNVYTGIKTIIGEEDVPTTTIPTNKNLELSRPPWNSASHAPKKVDVAGSISIPSKSLRNKEMNIINKKQQDTSDHIENIVTSQPTRFLNTDDEQDDSNNESEYEVSKQTSGKLNTNLHQNARLNKLTPTHSINRISSNLTVGNIRQKSNLSNVSHLHSANQSKTVKSNPKYEKQKNTVPNIKLNTRNVSTKIDVQMSSQRPTISNTLKYQPPKKLQPTNKLPITVTRSVKRGKNQISPRPISNVTNKQMIKSDIIISKSKTSLSEPEIKRNELKIPTENDTKPSTVQNPFIENDNKFSKSMTIADIVNQTMKKRNDSNETNSDKVRKEKAKLWLRTLETIEPIQDNTLQNHENYHDHQSNDKLNEEEDKIFQVKYKNDLKSTQNKAKSGKNSDKVESCDNDNKNLTEGRVIVGETKEIRKSFFSNQQDDAGDFDNDDFYLNEFEYRSNFMKNSRQFFDLY